MNGSSMNDASATDTSPVPVDANLPASLEVQRSEVARPAPPANRRWWLKLLLQPLLLLICGTLLIIALGGAQRLGWISAGGNGGPHAESGGGHTGQYICPMMCTPPQSEPGRCPVCAMELVPATASGGPTDFRAITIDSATRRVANIQTVSVASRPILRTIRAVGDLSYNEGSWKTISAYVDGRLEQLYADYTGVVVQKGDELALVYSPKLYSAQVEYLLTQKGRAEIRVAASQRFAQSDLGLAENAKQRLIELGMTMPQIDELEQRGQADSRLHLVAPMSGTVIEKFAVEGEYVNEGEPIYRLADLSTLWLMLRLFPEDAAMIRYGQKVEAEFQSLPGRMFTGRVAFIDPSVDPTTRTVGVRVVMPNADGVLRPGDFAKANIETPLSALHAEEGLIYDPELANRWISPRHPHVVESSPGRCRECGVPLVPATQLGFTDEPGQRNEMLVVPRDAVLMAGSNSVIYIETEPGRFEIREVVLGPSLGREIVILSGVKPGESVALRGNFLIDSQMQLAGNPSLIDPTKVKPITSDETSMDKVMVALADLNPQDREAAKEQGICPVTKMSLGSMGTPPKLHVKGEVLFLCCKACERRLLDDPDKYLVNLPGDGEESETEREP